MKFIAAYERSSAILNEQNTLLHSGEIEHIVELELEKDELLRAVDWTALSANPEHLKLAQELLTRQQAFEQQCVLVREGLMEQLSKSRKQHKALASYLDNR
ncbi:MAG: hypothetical protein GYB21_09625 [Oceanospirillales bacterium]|nr:hypothetical protein [Oceanospirillales bacterium]